MLPKPLRLLPCLLAPLMGQDPDDLRDLQAALDRPIAIASKRVQRLKEAPADATVITAGELEAMGYTTLGEALEGTLGFRTNRDHAYEGLAVRGLYLLGDQNTRVLILLDGHALNNPAEVGSSKVGQDFGIPLARIERIEVVRGPASSLHGNNAFLGMVNIVTKRQEGEGFSLAAGVLGSTRREGTLWADAGGSLGSARWSLLAQGFQRPGDTLEVPALGPSSLPRELDREEAQGAYLRLHGPGWSFRGQALSRTQGLATAPFGTTLGDPSTRYRNRVLSGDLRLEPTWRDVAFLIRAFGDHNTFGSVLPFDGVRTPGTSGLFSESDPDRALGLELQARFPTGPHLYWTRGSERQWHRYDGWVGDPSGGGVSTRTAYVLGNTYLQGEWNALESITFILGLQSASWQVQEASQDFGAGPIGLPARTLSGTTPRVAFVWRPTALDILKVLVGQGYRNPTIFERFYADGIAILNNPALRPERIGSTSAVWIRIWGNGLQSQLSATRSRWQDQVFTADAGGGAIQARNDPSGLDGTAFEGELQGAWPGWELKAHLGAYRWERQGRRVDNAAPMEAAVRLTRRLEAWSLSGEVRHVGPRSLPGITAPAATTSRLALRRDFGATWGRLTVEDLGQARRRDLVAREYAPVQALPGDGRFLRLELGWRLP